MNNQQYDKLLNKVCAHLKALSEERGPVGKGFGSGDPLNDPNIAKEDKEYFFVLGDVIASDNDQNILTAPYKTGDRIVWAIKKVAETNGFDLAIHYYVFGEDSTPIATLGYFEESAANAAENIYQFLVNGTLPLAVKQLAN